MPGECAHFYYSVLTLLIDVRLGALRMLLLIYQFELSLNSMDGNLLFFPVTRPQGENSYSSSFLMSFQHSLKAFQYLTQPSSLL